MKRKVIEESFELLKAECPELKDIVLSYSDARMGRLVALAKTNEHGSIWPKTNFMNYSQMNAFLYGYSLGHHKHIHLI
jgi:hypothetical protein